MRTRKFPNTDTFITVLFLKKERQLFCRMSTTSSQIMQIAVFLRIPHFPFYSYYQKTEECWGDWPIIGLKEHLISKADHPVKETQYRYTISH